MRTPEGADQEWPLEPCAGDTHTDPEGRLWLCCPIAGGSKTGRWTYCVIVGQPWKGVVADTRQHLQAVHFAGMLALPWDGLSKLGWVLAKEHCQPIQEKLEVAPKDAVRFERLEEPPKEDE